MGTKMEWVVAASNTDEVTEQVNALLKKHHLDSYKICEITRIHSGLTDYKVTFSKQV